MERTSVLLIDDDPDMATITGRVVEKAGLRFLWARTAQQGLAEIVDKAPDVVLLDHMLPDMNGLDFLRALRQDPAYTAVRDTPVMMLTAYEPKRAVTDQMFRLGLCAYLQKPFGHRELVNIIWNVNERHRIQQEETEETNGANQIADLRKVVAILQKQSRSAEGKSEPEGEQRATVDQLLSLARRLIEELQSARKPVSTDSANSRRS